MDVFSLIRKQDWRQLACLSDYEDPLSKANDDNEWNFVLSKNVYDWTIMYSSIWGNFGALIYYGQYYPHRLDQINLLKCILDNSISMDFNINIEKCNIDLIY